MPDHAVFLRFVSKWVKVSWARFGSTPTSHMYDIRVFPWLKQAKAWYQLCFLFLCSKTVQKMLKSNAFVWITYGLEI